MPVVFPCCNIPFVLLSSFTVSVCIATSYCHYDGPEEETRYACLVYFSCDYIQTLLYHVTSNVFQSRHTTIFVLLDISESK
jgi:hypothetical protein